MQLEAMSDILSQTQVEAREEQAKQALHFAQEKNFLELKIGEIALRKEEVIEQMLAERSQDR